MSQITVDELAQEIRRVDGSNSLGAGALAEALMEFLGCRDPKPVPEGTELLPCPFCGGTKLLIGHLGGINCRSCCAEVYGAGSETDDVVWNRRALAAQAVAVKPTLGDMPSYGAAKVTDLLNAVAEAIYGIRDISLLDSIDHDRLIGHQMVPNINFNSLNRIVTAFASPPEPQDIPDFKPCIIVYPEGGISEMLLEDCPTIVGQELTVRPILRMSEDKAGRDIIGFQWDTAAAPKPEATE